MTQSFIKSISKSAKAAVVAALALVFWASGAAGAFFVCAQDKGTEARECVQRVYYRFDSAAIMASYMSNAATLETIDSLATVCAANGVSGLQITSFSSLEGKFNYNMALSERRANALKDYIVELHPLLRSRISTNVQAESWEDLKNLVLGDSRFTASEKDEIVSIIDSGDEPDTREARLKKLPTYSRLYAAYFRSLRYAEIRFVVDYAAAAAGKAAASETATSGMAAGQVGVLFPANTTSVERDYASNGAALEELANILSSHKPEDFESIVIVAGSSIEGDSSNNARVSREYAENLASWIEENYPEYKGRIVVNPCGENWDAFRSAVESDSNLDEATRNSVLAIVDSNDSLESKEAQLKKLSCWDYLKENVLPQTRRATVDFTYSAAAAEAATEDGIAAGTASEGAQAGETTSTEAGASAAAGASATGTQAGETASEGTHAAGTGTTVTREADGTTTTRTTDGTAHVLFPLNGTTVKADHANNSEVFNEIAKILDGRKPEDFESVVVVSSSSIDGPVSSNDGFSRERGESLVKWIEENYPEFKGHVVLDSRGEDWDAFIEAIKADNHLSDSEKNDILDIATSNDSNDAKEARLRKLSTWEGYIKDNILPLTRRASMHATRAKVEAPTPEALPDVEVAEDTLAVNDRRDSLDTTVAPVDTLAAPVAPEVRKPLFAVSTNALYDLAITPNFAIEVPVGKKVSLYGEYTFPWWVSRDNSRAWQILKWDLGARYWFFGGRSENPMDVMIGPFAGIDLGAGYYDIEPHHKGWQGEFQTVGLEIGWAWDLGKDWRLDAFIGAGWLGSHSRIYEGSTDDKHLIFQDYGKLTWFGPTKVGVSFKYIFGHKERREEK